MLGQISPEQIFAFMLIFSRLGMIMFLMPGIGERYVPTWVRLALALALGLIVYPLIAPQLPAIPTSVFALAGLVIGESIIGAFIGGIARLTIAALHAAGTIVAFQTSLAYAQTVDPTQGSQGALIAAFFNLLGITLIFTSGLHFILIQGLLDSYQLFPAGQAPMPGDTAMAVTALVAKSFAVGLQMAAPFIVYGLIFYLGLGLLQRLMPQIQLFFVAIPLQMTLGFVMLMLIMSASMMWFMTHFEATATIILAN